MRLLTVSSFSTSPLSLTNTAMGTPQARWRDSTQSGRSSIMPRRRFWPAFGTKRVSSIALRAISLKVSAGASAPPSVRALALAALACAATEGMGLSM